MKNKKYNQLLLLSFFIITILVSAVNYFIDPFFVFRTSNIFNIDRPKLNKNHRVSKIPDLKLYKNKVDAIWVGSSRTWEGSNEEYEAKILKKDIQNLAMSSCTFPEAITMIENALLIHPEIKTIYWGIDFNFMGEKVNVDVTALQKIKDKNITKEEIIPLLFSLDTLNNSIVTIVKNLKQRPNINIEVIEYGTEKQNNPRVYHKFESTVKKYYKESYNIYELDNEKFLKLKDFIKDLRQKGVEVVFFVTSMHISERVLIYNTNNLDDFYTFKEKLAEIQPYYDFAIINKYTTEEIKPDMFYFKDSVHTRPPLRKKISNQLFLNNEDFGVLINKDNVKQVNEKDKKTFMDFIKNNEQFVEQIREWSN